MRWAHDTPMESTPTVPSTRDLFVKNKIKFDIFAYSWSLNQLVEKRDRNEEFRTRNQKHLIQ